MMHGDVTSVAKTQAAGSDVTEQFTVSKASSAADITIQDACQTLVDTPWCTVHRSWAREECAHGTAALRVLEQSAPSIDGAD